MNLELRHLRSLVAVADAGTFTDAAISLGTSQASISRSVAALESALGVRVFQRTTRSVPPTAAGKRIVEPARRVLDEAALLEEAARDHAGELRVGYAWSALGSRTIALRRRLGAGRALPVGFVLLGAAFVAAALTSGQAGSPGDSIAPLAGAVALLILGHMLLTPTILSLIPSFIPAERAASGRGAYYGLAASCGGTAVLIGNAVMGQLLELTDRLGWWPGMPWVFPVLLAFLSALALPRVLPTTSVPAPAARVAVT